MIVYIESLTRKLVLLCKCCYFDISLVFIVLILLKDNKKVSKVILELSIFILKHFSIIILWGRYIYSTGTCPSGLVDLNRTGYGGEHLQNHAEDVLGKPVSDSNPNAILI